MGRHRIHNSNAARQAAYRLRLKQDVLKQIPVVQGDGYTLYQGDAWQILPALRGVDAVVTDPPYSAVAHAGARGGGMRQTKLIPFAPLTTTAAIALVKQCCALARGWVVLTMDWRHVSAVEAACPTLFVRHGIWVKPNGAPQFTGDRPGTGWESIVVCHRPGRKAWNGGGKHGVWEIPRIIGQHPTEKPLALMTNLINDFTSPGAVVLDPFMGHATTGVACLEQQRRFIGIEQDPQYFQLACDRLADAARQVPLFALPLRPQQAALW